METEPRNRGRLVIVMSAKGGCGATLLSVNLAAAGGEGTAVLDLDFSKGDVAGYLDVWPERSVKDALLDAGRIDLMLLRGLATRHSSGIDVLPQPLDLSELVAPSAAEIRHLLSLAREGWATVVTDCGSRLDEATLAAAMEADEIVLVTLASVPALRDARRVLRLLERLGVPQPRVHLVVNRWRDNAALNRFEIEQQLGVPVAATIARDSQTATRADYTGHLLSAVAPRAEIVSDIDALWALIAGKEEESELEPERRRSWKFWKRARGSEEES